MAACSEPVRQATLESRVVGWQSLSGRVGRKMRLCGLCLFLLFCAVGLSGCDGSEPHPTLVNVHGLVSYLERPLSGGSIVFIPDEEHGNTGPLVHADIQPDGTYSLRNSERPGVPPGSYRVTVRSSGPLPGQGGQYWPQPPEKYSDPRTSGLTCKVLAVEQHTINFHLQ